MITGSFQVKRDDIISQEKGNPLKKADSKFEKQTELNQLLEVMEARSPDRCTSDFLNQSGTGGGTTMKDGKYQVFPGR